MSEHHKTILIPMTFLEKGKWSKNKFKGHQINVYPNTDRNFRITEKYIWISHKIGEKINKT